MSECEEGKPTRIDRRTAVSLGLVSTLLPLGIGMHLWLSAQFEAVHAILRDVDKRLERMEERTADAWTHQQQETWALRLQLQNPNLKVPPTPAGQGD